MKRREFLQSSLGLLASHFLPLEKNVLSQEQQPLTIEEILKNLAPFPGKQKIVLEEYQQSGMEGPIIRLLTERKIESLGQIIRPIANWQIEQGPNYTSAFENKGEKNILAACFYGQAVSKVNANKNTVEIFYTGLDTNPLDVAYDAKRKRIIVGSANLSANFLVLDEEGKILHKTPLGELLDQGICNGGVQGVTVDAQGNYWAALAYCGQAKQGVLIKIDGETFKPVKIIKDQGMNNPNGIVTSANGKEIFAFSDNGWAHRFDLDGELKQEIPTLPLGYRGTVNGNDLWVTGWLSEGKMIKYNLETGKREEFPCAPLGNSIKVDKQSLVWVAGDSGVSVSTYEGEPLAMRNFGAFTNGLSTLGNDVFFVSYDNRLHYVQANLDSQQMSELFFPIIFNSGS